MVAIRDVEHSTDDEVLIGIQPSFVQRLAKRKKMLAGGLGCGALLLASAGVAYLATPHKAAASEVEAKYTVHTIPPSDNCVPQKINCHEARCCSSSGYMCYAKDATWAECKKQDSCVPGKDGSCELLLPTYAEKPSFEKPGTALFCFSLYVKDMGPADTLPPNHQLELLKAQYHTGASIFGCPSWAVYSDVAGAELAPGVATRLITNPGDWHDFKRRDKPYFWANAMIYYSAWTQMKADGLYKAQDWVVKVDPWSVFIPQRLVDFLATQDVTINGAYFENCKFVEEGFFGNLEVVSTHGFTTFLDNLPDCKTNLKWDGSGKWKYGAWGEDLFLQKCLDRRGVSKLPGYGMSDSGTCPNNRPASEKKNTKYIPSCDNTAVAVLHPFKDTKSYFTCLGKVMNRDFSTSL